LSPKKKEGTSVLRKKYQIIGGDYSPLLYQLDANILSYGNQNLTPQTPSFTNVAEIGQFSRQRPTQKKKFQGQGSWVPTLKVTV
jgi:hypothetical protein